MQLFITDEYQIKNEVIITEKRIIDQLRKVLRAKAGYIFYLQNKTLKQNITTRYKIEVIEIKDKIIGKIIEKEEKNLENLEKKGIITAILNKFDKMELIVQKLTEIGIYEIGFAPFQRSIFKDIKEKKLERFHKIALEAAEQSWSWFYPEIKIYSKLEQISGNKAILDFDGEFYKNIDYSNIDYILIGPEGGITEQDLKTLGSSKKVNLGQNVLRAETASIVGGFILNS